jgi:hypothetical protein
MPTKHYSLAAAIEHKGSGFWFLSHHFVLAIPFSLLRAWLTG